MLAAGAVIGAAPRLANLSDHAAAAQARLARPVVNPGLDLETASPAVAMHIVADAAATGGNRIRQGFADSRHENAVARPADPVGRPQRRNTGPEQAFRGIDITDADHQMAVHQGRLDRPTAAGNRLEQPVRRESIGQGFDALRRQKRMAFRRCRRPGLPEHDTEAARVGKAQGLPGKQQVEMIVLFRRQVGRYETQVARHPEMDDQRSLDALPPTVDQQVFAAPAHRDDPATGQQVEQGARDLVAQLRRPDQRTDDDLPAQFRLYPAPTDFHLRQFRHCLFLRANPNNIAN